MTIEQRSLLSITPSRTGEGAMHYSLADLLVLVTTLACALAMLRQFGIFGCVACFIGLLILTLVVYPCWRLDDDAIQHAAFDIAWGIVMPLVCFGTFVFSPPVWSGAADQDDLLASWASSSF